MPAGSNAIHFYVLTETIYNSFCSSAINLVTVLTCSVELLNSMRVLDSYLTSVWFFLSVATFQRMIRFLVPSIWVFGFSLLLHACLLRMHVSNLSCCEYIIRASCWVLSHRVTSYLLVNQRRTHSPNVSWWYFLTKGSSIFFLARFAYLFPQVEHVIREEKFMQAYDLIEVYCELMVARMSIIDSQK